MKNISVEENRWIMPETEIVERKGFGHPDSISDGCAEAVSRELSKYYLENFGTILHHNVDKFLLIAGRASPEFGGGEIIKPMILLQSGRAITEVGEKKIPVDEIARKAIIDYMSQFRHLNVELHTDIDIQIGQGSQDLTELFERGKIPLANDTSFGVGYYPFDALEKMVLETETYLNSKEYLSKHPWLGEDIKVMGLRNGENYKITVAAAFVSKYVSNVDEYVKFKEEMKNDLDNLLASFEKEVEVNVNTADDPSKGSVYITVTGLSAENGDDGEVGRGNRGNGLITPSRPMSLEALAGKNPVNHVGKLYNVLANRIAKDIVEGIPEVSYASVEILSQIGKPINEPQVLKIALEGDVDKARDKARYIAEKWLEEITSLTDDFVEGKINVF